MAERTGARILRANAEWSLVQPDKLGCYSDDTEVLTECGWIPFKLLTKEYKVAALMNGNELQYVNPTELQIYDHEGKMYKVKSNHVDLLVTPNHRMWVAKQVKTASVSKQYDICMPDEIEGKQMHYKKNATMWEPTHPVNEKFMFPKSRRLPELEVNMNDWLVFLGIWYAEGWCDASAERIDISVDKKRVKDALTECCKNLGFDIGAHGEDSKGMKNKWYCYNKRLLNYLQPLSTGAVNKSLPSWVFNLNQEQAQILINSMLLGDGYTTKTAQPVYCTSSHLLADEFQRLCLHAGWSANILVNKKAGHTSTMRDGRVITATEDGLEIRIIKKQNEPLVNRYIKQGKPADSWVDYKGKVYCCTVPGDGVVYVRRNGVPIWSGNSRHGQKGCCGLKERGRYFPYLEKTGTQVDLIINPHAIPSRMTIAQLHERQLAMLGALNGRIYDGTAFSRPDMRSVGEQLKELGYAFNGHEIVRDGLTGKRYKCAIFVGFTYYQRLKHLVLDKIHARAEGRMQILTRQPNEGRSKDGALRVGEMERDALISSGLSMFLQECFMFKSDAFPIYVCDDCGLFASHHARNKSYRCTACNNTTRISKIVIPAAFKLLVQELMAMSICLRIRTDKIDRLVTRRVRMADSQ